MKNSTIIMIQSKSIVKLLSKFARVDCKPRSTPCELDLTKTSDEVDLIDNKPYREIIGTLIRVAIRAYICFPVTRLSQDHAKPNSFHLTKARHVLRYLKSTINQSLIFKESLKHH